MRILVSGSTGFIGSHLVPKLVDLGHDVCALHRYVTGRYVLGENVKMIFGNLQDTEGIVSAVKEADPQVCIHLASISPVAYSYTHPQEVNMTNYLGLINLAEACRTQTTDFRHFISAGTSEEYGNQVEVPIRETAKLKPNSPYAVSKVASTKYLEYMYDAYDFPMTICRPFNCYDEKTEVLTYQGWKYFKDLDKTDLVATLNPNTHELQYQQPFDYIESQYEGNMIQVSGSQIDLLVTPNHRMYVRKRYGESYEIMVAEDLLKYNGKRSVYFKHNADWSFRTTVIGNWHNPSWIKFMAWWLSEGSLDRRPNHNGIDIRQCDLENLEEIYDVVVDLGYKPHRNHIKNERVGFSDERLHKYLLQFGYSKEKFVPQEIKNLPKHLIQLFLETYQKGDGSRGSHNGYEVRDCLLSNSPRMIDDLQELVLKAGWASSSNGRFLTIARTRLETCPRTPQNFTKEKYNGMIYCVSVPNEIIYVRRNGKGVWCGNTYGRIKNKHFVVERILTQMLEGKEAIHLGDPKPVRDLMFREDHVNAYLSALLKDSSIGETFNFCTGVGVSIQDLVADCCFLTKWKGLVYWHTIPPRPLDIDVLIGDNKKAQKILNWKPEYTLQQGLKETIKGLKAP